MTEIMAEIVLINPRFEASYWGLEHALPLLGKRASVPPACLPLLAALTPDKHQVTLLDENIQPIDYDRVARADIVGLTGMNVQRARMREVLDELKQRGAFTVVGGPWVSVCEDYFGDLADVVFVGEAEETWSQFLRDWRAGRHKQRYEQAQRTDMTRVYTRTNGSLRSAYGADALRAARASRYRCEACAFADVRVLNLDHVDGRVAGTPFACLCANCHAIKSREYDWTGDKPERVTASEPLTQPFKPLDHYEGDS